MAAPFPQVAIGDRVDVIEIDQAICATVHDRERNMATCYRHALVPAFPGARGREETLAEAAVCPRNGITQERLGRLAEDSLNEAVDVGVRQVPPPRDP